MLQHGKDKSEALQIWALPNFFPRRLPLGVSSGNASLAIQNDSFVISKIFIPNQKFNDKVIIITKEDKMTKLKIQHGKRIQHQGSPIQISCNCRLLSDGNLRSSSLFSIG